MLHLLCWVIREQPTCKTAVQKSWSRRTVRPPLARPHASMAIPRRFLVPCRSPAWA